MTPEEIYAFLKTQRLAVLATVGPEGAPQSALMGIAVTPDFEVIFDTVKSSRKYPNLIARPECSFVAGGWHEAEQTVQYEGHARELAAPELERYLEIYFRTWPECRAHLAWPDIVHFVVRPKWLRYTEYVPERRLQEIKFWSYDASTDERTS
jgi:hypothetical protein